MTVGNRIGSWVGSLFCGAFAILALGAFTTSSSYAADAVSANDYADPGAWLCRPGRADSCSAPLSATVLTPDGGRSNRDFKPDPAAPIDCFYVYPTVSREPQPNSDMIARSEEIRAATAQFARFSAKCRPYAPLYRQVTLAGLHAALEGDKAGLDGSLPYRDVLDAWRSYMTNDNHGRGVVLIGHSQGARILTRLVAAEIDGKPAQRQLVSGMLIGTDIEVPAGRDMGGTFKHIPLCRHASETGCVIAYSSYLDSAPPGPDAHFGASSKAGSVYACVNPQYLIGDAALEPDLPPLGSLRGIFDTTFIENPGLLTARCLSRHGFNYLQISVEPGPVGDKVDAALARLSARLPGWGLHVFDVNLALGDLVDLAGMESAAWIRNQSNQ